MDRLHGTRLNTSQQVLKPTNINFQGNKHSEVNFTSANATIKPQPCKDQVCFAGPLTGGTR